MGCVSSINKEPAGCVTPVIKKRGRRCVSKKRIIRTLPTGEVLLGKG